MTTSTSIVLYAFLFLIVVVVEIFVIHYHKSLIQEALAAKEARVIKISWQPFDFDKSNHTYLVEYEDASGRPVGRQCKIHFLGSTIYWEE